jgi:hypothetical protein
VIGWRQTLATLQSHSCFDCSREKKLPGGKQALDFRSETTGDSSFQTVFELSDAYTLIGI